MWKWIRRILFSLVGAVVIMIGVLVAVVIGDGVVGATASDYTNTTFTAADGTTLHGYLAQPEAEGIYPGVLMIHEWWGMNEEITELADALAEEGFVVFAPDTYRGETTSLIPRAIVLRLSVPEERVNDDMQSAFEYLSSLENVSAAHIGVVGFCYGGGVALRHGINNPEIAAVINLYGDRVTDPAAFGALLDEGAAPVLGIFGGADQTISLESVSEFEAALQSADVDHTISIYDDMGHAFVQPHNIDEAGQPQDAWQQIISFFNMHLMIENTEVEG